MVKKRKRNSNTNNKAENDVQQPETKKNKKDFRQYLTDPETGESIPLTKSGQPDMRCSKSKRYMERLNTSNNTNNSDTENSSINDCSQNATFNDSSSLNISNTLLLHHPALKRISSNECENTSISLNNSAIADTSPSTSIILSSSSSSTTKAAVPSSEDITEMCKLKCNQSDLPSTLSALLEKLKLYEKQQGQNGSQEFGMITSSSSTQTDLVEMLKKISYSPFSVQTDPIPSETKSAQTSNPCSVPLIEATTQTDDIQTKLRHVETQYHCTLHRFPISTQTPSPPTTQTTGTQTEILNSSESTTTNNESEAEEEEEDKNLDFCRVI